MSMMKKKASSLWKQTLSILTSITKAKSLALKTKTNALKTKLIIFSLLKTKKPLLGPSIEDDDVDDIDQSKAIVLYNKSYAVDGPDDDDDDKYPDLTHCFFDEEECEDDVGGSVIELVKNSKEGEGEDFKLEDEIDHVADLFIMRFHRQMRLQKLESFKRFQEMLARGV